MKWITGVLALTLAAAAAACGGEPGELRASSEAVYVEVSTAAASSGIMTAPGTVVATEEAELATRISGTIRQVLADIGARVSEGAPVVTLDSEEIDARIRSAEAATQLARQWHQRIAALAADGVATAQELDDANARLEISEAALRDARAQRDYVSLRAPFDGVITARMADPGDLAVPGIPILKMIGTTSTKIEADLPAELAGRLAVGDPVDVYHPETARRYPAKLTRVVPAVERTSRRFRVEARFQPDSTRLPSIPPGAFVRIELGEPTTITRWIPADVLVTRGQLEGVFVVDGDELRLRWVRLGQRLGETVELLAGTGTDALLVRAPAAHLVDGQPVAGVRLVAWLPPFVDQPASGMEGTR